MGGQKDWHRERERESSLVRAVELVAFAAGSRAPCSPSPTKEGGELCISITGQILGTRAESQQIVAARPLYCLQYPVPAKSSA